MTIIDAANCAVDKYLTTFLPDPNREDRSIARCAILQMVAPGETSPDFLTVALIYHNRATQRFLDLVGGDGLFVLVGATLEECNAC